MELGLLIIPFYGTFKEIFKVSGPNLIEGYSDCIKSYFESFKIPPVAIKRVTSSNEADTTKIIQNVLGTQEDIDELMQKYKKPYFEKKLFSSPTVLYASKAFNELMGFLDEGEDTSVINVDKIGRNNPCPCGSGKKFKKCCLK